MLRILHLEDDPNDVELARAMLEEGGLPCEVTPVETEAGFLSALEKGGFDIVLADYRLPSFNGLSALGLIKEKKPGIPFIFVSGTMGEELAIETLKRGATDYVIKNRLSRLVPAVRRALKELEDCAERRKAEEELQRYRDHLEELVEARTAELKQVNLQLEKEIAERKIAEEIMARREQEIRIIAENVPALFSYIDAEGVYCFVNRRYEDWFGIPCGEIIGKPVRHIIGEPAYGVVENKIKSVLSGKKVSFEAAVPYKIGGTRWMSITYVPDTDVNGNVSGIYALTTDISEQKRFEEALRKSEEIYRTFINSTPDMVFVKDGQFRHIAVNKAQLEFLGVGEDQIIGKTAFDLLPGSSAAYCEHTDIEALRSEKPVIMEEKIGDRILETRKFRIKLGENEFGVGGYVRDITDAKRSEDELKHLTEELKRSNADLEQFAYSASHDLQEPLRMVAGFVKLLEKRFKGNLGEKADEYIQHTVFGVSRMQTLIKDLLEYSRLGTKGKTFKQTNCSEVLEQALMNLSSAVEENGAEVTYDLLPMVIADDSQLIRLFQNLISNAVKFHGKEPPRIHISAERKEGEWLFYVKDNGIGIDPKHSSRIFMIFQRLHTAEEYEGTGIGLSMCKKIVERHSGRIWVESETGKGSTFYFTLPATE